MFTARWRRSSAFSSRHRSLLKLKLRQIEAHVILLKRSSGSREKSAPNLPFSASVICLVPLTETALCQQHRGESALFHTCFPAGKTTRRHPALFPCLCRPRAVTCCQSVRTRARAINSATMRGSSLCLTHNAALPQGVSSGGQKYEPHTALYI